jgi:GDP-L-fucose synthase
MEKNSKIYVAGHNGLVGSAITRNLEKKGYTNLIFRSFHELNLTNQQETAEFFEKEKPDYVILAAAKVGGIVANNTYRAQFIYENVMIQNNVIHYSYVNGVKKLLFLGSSCIYPKESPQPMKEDYLLTDVLEYTNEPYAIAKITGMKMTESYNLQYGTNFISVMPTNLYGPNDNYDLEKSHVLPALIRKMHLGKCLMNGDWESIRFDFNQNPVEGTDGQADEYEILAKLKKYGIGKADNGKVNITLWGTGKPKREFLHSDDMADACVFIMENIDFENELLGGVKGGIDPENPTPVNKEVRNTHINIGTGKDLSIKELSEIVKSTVGYEGNIVWDASKPDGTMRKLLNVDKLHGLGWNEKISLEEGIKNVYNNYIR